MTESTSPSTLDRLHTLHAHLQVYHLATAELQSAATRKRATGSAMRRPRKQDWSTPFDAEHRTAITALNELRIVLDLAVATAERVHAAIEKLPEGDRP